MSDSVIVGVLSLLGLMYASTLPLLFSARKHAKTSAEQTRNSHSENMRDDLDLVIVAVHSIQKQHGIEDPLVAARAEKANRKNRRAL
jgi:hypothetical protein